MGWAGGAVLVAVALIAVMRAPGGVGAVGAAAGAGLTLLGLGGALAVSQRHTDLGAGPRRPGADRGPLPSASQSTRQSREFR